MNKFVLIEKNIEYLKSLLRKEYPQIKSSHLTEAIARGLNFGSNAALLDFISNGSNIYNRLINFNNLEFINWLYDKSYSGIIEFPESIYESIFLPPWVATNKVDIQNAHYFLCEKYQIPYIVIKPKGNKSDIHWDCICLDYEHDEIIFNSNLSKRIYELEVLYGTKKSFSVPNLFVGTIKSVENDNISYLAGEIFEIICLALEQNVDN